MQQTSILYDLVRTTNVLSEDMNRQSVSRGLVEQALDVTRSDAAALYVLDPDKKKQEELPLLHRRGRYDLPKHLPLSGESVNFLLDSRETLVINNPGGPFFGDIFLHSEMKSAIASPLVSRDQVMGLLFLNSRQPDHYGAARLSFIDSFNKMASGMLQNIDLFQELKDRLKEIEGLHRYQTNVFTSMTNLLVTSDSQGKLKYFNPSAGKSFGIRDEDVGKPMEELFLKDLSRKVRNQVKKVSENGRPVLGLEGVYEADGREMDYSLNIAPLKTSRGSIEGLTYLFTDQTQEQELKSQMESAVEERRVVKDMFSRYLSTDIVHQLMEHPDNVRLGGEKKDATIFFADITGYTSFSEGKDPEYVVEVLNDFFSVSLEVVIKYGGYIDKLIGDCIMAAFGVPMGKGDHDAINAVSCAVEIQNLIQDKNRKFFTGEASHLRVSIGMNSGPVVVGNLGSSRRMDYSVISDTVNVAARLEGVASANDIIISSHTRDIVGDRFRLKELKPVSVKGKKEPIPIFNVLGIKR